MLRKILVPTLVLVCGCQPGKKDDDGKTEGLPTDTASNTDTATDTGNLAVDLTPNEVFVTMGAAMVSAAEAKSEAGVSLNPGTVALTTLTDEAAPCRASGGPNVDNNDSVQGTGKFAGMSAYCDLSQHPDGPDTTLGGIDRVQSLLCAAGDALVFDGEPHEVEMVVDSKCFSESFVAMANEQGFTKIKQVVTGKEGVAEDFGSPGYKRSLTIEPAADAMVGFNYSIELSQADGVLSAAVRGGASDDLETDSDAFAINLDTKAEGSIRYEGRFTRLGKDGGPGNFPRLRHLRVLAQGTYDKEKSTFTAISNLNYAFWDVNFEGGDKVMTVTGAPGKGYRAVIFGTTPAFVLANYTPSKDQTYCYGGDCEGNDGLLITKEEDFGFAKSCLPGDDAYVAADAWFKKHGPLAYESVQFLGEQD